MSEFENKVLKLLENINGKLDSLLKGGTGVSSSSSTVISSAPAPVAAPDYRAVNTIEKNGNSKSCKSLGIAGGNTY